MSLFVPEEWPADLRNDGIVARDPQQLPQARCAALRRLCTALDEDSMNNALRDQILSLSASLVVVDQDRMIENEAIVLLGPTVRLTAERAILRFPGRAAFECQEEAEGLIWQRLKSGKFVLDRGTFEGWCFSVLRNDLRTRLRRSRGDPLVHAYPIAGGTTDSGEAIGVDPPADELQLTIERALDSEFQKVPFSKSDIEQIETWQLDVRLVLLCLSGLWPKAPNDRWESWAVEAQVEMPFPQEGFAERETATERQEWLAAALGLSPDAVTQTWYRNRKRFDDLKCIRELRP